MPPDVGLKACSPELPAHHPSPPSYCLLALWCGTGLWGPASQGTGNRLEVLGLVCPPAKLFDQRHSWDDIPEQERPAQLRARGTASHQHCCAHACIQACPPHVNQPVHPTPDTHRLLYQLKYRFAWQAHLAVPASSTGFMWPA